MGSSHGRGVPPGVLVVADVLDVLDHIGTHPMLLHDGQHLSVHQVMRPEAVEITAVAPGEVLADVKSLAGLWLPADLFPALSFVTFAYLGQKKRVALDQEYCQLLLVKPRELMVLQDLEVLFRENFVRVLAKVPLRVGIVAPAQQVELAEVQAVAGSLAELATADAGSGGGHHRPNDPGLASDLQQHEAIGPRRLEQLVELRLGERDLTQQFLQGHAAPVGAQDLGDETAYPGVGHGALWLPRLWPQRGTPLREESKLTGGPRGGRGRCRLRSFRFPTLAAATRDPTSPGGSWGQI